MWLGWERMYTECWLGSFFEYGHLGDGSGRITLRYTGSLGTRVVKLGAGWNWLRIMPSGVEPFRYC